MRLQWVFGAAVLTAACLLGLPLRGPSADESEIGTPMTLADAGSAAPNFVGIKTWLNSAPLNIAELRGKVVLVDFWTYGCYNCVNTLPHVTRLYDTYKAVSYTHLISHFRVNRWRKLQPLPDGRPGRSG